MRIGYQDSPSKWSDETAEFTTSEFKACAWKECPDYVDWNKKYSVDVNNPRIVSKIGDDISNCTIIGNTPIPLDKTTFWNIKILKLKNNDEKYIYTGVAPFDINQK